MSHPEICGGGNVTPRNLRWWECYTPEFEVVGMLHPEICGRRNATSLYVMW